MATPNGGSWIIVPAPTLSVNVHLPAPFRESASVPENVKAPSTSEPPTTVTFPIRETLKCGLLATTVYVGAAPYSLVGASKSEKALEDSLETLALCGTF
jgi:hypothetical protein